MSRETERFFKAFHEYLKSEHIVLKNEADAEKYLNQFMENYNQDLLETPFDGERAPNTSDDYLQLAMEADTPEDALVYAKRALTADKGNLDAEIMIAELTSKDDDALQKKYQSILKKGKKQLTEAGFWNEEYFGDFWMILETRPYMRVRYGYIEHLISQGKLRKAIAECEDMLKLCETDNMGIRYKLIHLYAFYEDELSAMRLYKRYDGFQDTMLLLPLILLYHRLDHYVQARKYLKLLCSANPETENFFLQLKEDDIEEMFADVIEEGAYQYNSAEEFVMAIMENMYFYTLTGSGLAWIARELDK